MIGRTYFGQTQPVLNVAMKAARQGGWKKELYEFSANLAGSILPRKFWKAGLTRDTINSQFAIQAFKNNPEENDLRVPFQTPLGFNGFSLKEIADGYDGFFVDLAGVVSHGDKTYPWSAETLKILASQDKKIIFLSNAANWTVQDIIQRTARHGFSIDPDFVVTSGSALSLVLKSGEKIFMVGHQACQEYITQTGAKIFSYGPVGRPDKIVISSFDETLDECWKQLDQALEYARQGVPVILANPDKTFPGGDGRLYYGTGRAADILDSIRIPYTIVGKPDPLIYQMAMSRLMEKGINIPKEKILMVGDTIENDILGARNFGIDSLLVLSGNHNQISPEKFWNLFRKQAAPNYVLNRFSFT